MHATHVSRRAFLQSAGALVVGFSLAGPLGSAFAQGRRLPNGELDPTSLDSWLAIDRDGNVTMFTSKVDLGTGVVTALSQIVAEELDVPFDRIKMETGDTDNTIDQFATVGSRTIERGGPQLRQAAAAARQELLVRAAERLGAPIAQLTVTDGVIRVTGAASRRLSYAEIVGGSRFNATITATGTGWDMKVADSVRRKAPKDYTIVGTSVRRVDLPSKLTGEFTFAHDMRVPGMLHGRVVRPPFSRSKPLSIDHDSVARIPGLVKVVSEGAFVGVVAETESAAIEAARALKVSWSPAATGVPATPEEVFAYLRDTKSLRDQVVVNKGNADGAIAEASKTFASTYRWPFQIHAMLGPSCAVADVRSERVTVWAGTQGVFRTRKAVADLLGRPERDVRVIYREASGCYGRLSNDDVAEDAALLSRAVARPVRVQWSRQDEHAWSPKGPAQFLKVRAGVDAQGRLTAWDFMDRSFPWTENTGPLLASREIGLKSAGPGNPNGIGAGGQEYAIEHQRIVAALIPWVWPEPIPLRTCNLRAPGELARCFASECFLDEVAAGLQTDPVAFRLRHLGQNKRAIDALVAATEKAGWRPRPSPAPAAGGNRAVGRGVALSNRSAVLCAAVAEVEVDRASGKVAVTRITISHECGLVVNPDGLRNQIEGNVIQGVSRALMEEVKFDASGIKSVDWASYPILSFAETPEIEIVIMNRPEMPALGGGEPSIVPIAAAIGNAIFDATGIRLRDVPFPPARVVAARTVS